MSQENVEVVTSFERLMSARESHDAAGDYAPILELLDPDVVAWVPRGMPHAGRWVGHDGFVRMAEAIVDARKVTDFQITHLDTSDEEKVITLASITHEMNGEASGPFRMVVVYSVRNGKITALDSFYEDTRFFGSE